MTEKGFFTQWLSRSTLRGDSRGDGITRSQHVPRVLTLDRLADHTASRHSFSGNNVTSFLAIVPASDSLFAVAANRFLARASLLYPPPSLSYRFPALHPGPAVRAVFLEGLWRPVFRSDGKIFIMRTCIRGAHFRSQSKSRGDRQEAAPCHYNDRGRSLWSHYTQ